ncbi:alpha-L-fucosidase-like isoform X1 [Ornithodoros turicata]|uniref:alpha-L-fucosidase-like isoform X1 n=1 Tax=Ornithodoros turicata TaxID=34597 RepID=UPI0031391CE4
MTLYTVLFWMCTLVLLSRARYEPNWKSLDTRPLPSWYDEAKIGIFVHWGVFSVPSFGNEWFWMNWVRKRPGVVKFMKTNYKPGFTYPDFAPHFTAEFFDPGEWADIFARSGARYVVLTSKHHEGYALWPSKVSWNWNSMDVGPKRDLVGDLAKAIRSQTNLHFGVYHSLLEWFNPLYLQDKANKWRTNHFVQGKTMVELYDLVNNYRPEVIWSDGDWEARDTYWNSTAFLAWLYNDSPVRETVVVNDRWGINANCKHGDFYNCKDNYDPGVLMSHKWERCTTIDMKSWGYRRHASAQDYLTIEELLRRVVKTISCNGNILINVGPTKDGVITPVFQERLLQLGSWLKVNGEGLYASKPWKHQNDSHTPGVWYTQKADNVFAYVLQWPKGNVLTLHSLKLNKASRITLLGYDKGDLAWYTTPEGAVAVEFPAFTPYALPCQWAWTLKIQGAM